MTICSFLQPNHRFFSLLPIFPHRIPSFITIINPTSLSRSHNFDRYIKIRVQSDMFKLRSEPSNTGRSSNPSFPLETEIFNALKALGKPVIMAVLLGFLLTFRQNLSLAASGGRVGGRSFSSSSSSSSSSSFSSSMICTSSCAGSMCPVIEETKLHPYLLAILALSFPLFMIFILEINTTVLKLQVGLLGMAKSLQMDLNRIAETADTSTFKDLSYIITETTLALLRHSDFCISGYSSTYMNKSTYEGEKCFNKLAIEERGKFDEESLVNVNNIRKQSIPRQTPKDFSNEYIVVTILVDVQGFHKLPNIISIADLKEALHILGCIPSTKILAVEVLWTPQSEGDTLSEPELLKDYPLLRPL